MTATLTGAQLANALNTTILPALTKIQAVMATPQFQNTEVVVEDLLKILAVFVPGASAVEMGVEVAAELTPEAVAAARLAIPIIATALPVWLTPGGLFAAAPGGWLGAPRAI